MFKLNGNMLKITQGDTGELEIVASGATYGNDDKCQLTVTDKDKNVLLQKVAGFTSNVASFAFATADTADIPEGV